jgi:hypothetical protein
MRRYAIDCRRQGKGDGTDEAILDVLELPAHRAMAFHTGDSQELVQLRALRLALRLGHCLAERVFRQLGLSVLMIECEAVGTKPILVSTMQGIRCYTVVQRKMRAVGGG